MAIQGTQDLEMGDSGFVSVTPTTDTGDGRQTAIEDAFAMLAQAIGTGWDIEQTANVEHRTDLRGRFKTVSQRHVKKIPSIRLTVDGLVHIVAKVCGILWHDM